MCFKLTNISPHEHPDWITKMNFCVHLCQNTEQQGKVRSSYSKLLKLCTTMGSNVWAAFNWGILYLWQFMIVWGCIVWLVWVGVWCACAWNMWHNRSVLLSISSDRDQLPLFLPVSLPLTHFQATQGFFPHWPQHTQNIFTLLF